MIPKGFTPDLWAFANDFCRQNRYRAYNAGLLAAHGDGDCRPEINNRADEYHQGFRDGLAELEDRTWIGQSLKR